MKKRILIIILCGILAILLVACKGEVESGGGEEPTTPPIQDPNGPDAPVESLSPADRDSELIRELVSYLKGYFDSCDLPPSNLEQKIDSIKDGSRPEYVSFDPESYYFVGGYYNAEHDHEKEKYCCVDEYTWVIFEDATQIQEYYAGEKNVVVFQVNRSLFTTDLLTGEQLTGMEHFQIFVPEFADAKNTNEPYVYGETYIYLKSYGDSAIYYSSRKAAHYLKTIPCEKYGKGYYIPVALYTVEISGEQIDYDLTAEFGEYYDILSSLMLDKELCKYDTKGNAHYFGIFEIEEFIEAAKYAGFVAREFAASPALDMGSRLALDAVGGSVYIGGSLYSKVTYVNNLSIIYTEDTLAGADEATLLVLDAIKNEKYCYLFRTTDEGAEYKTVAAYVIDGASYLVVFSGDKVAGVYAADIEWDFMAFVKDNVIYKSYLADLFIGLQGDIAGMDKLSYSSLYQQLYDELKASGEYTRGEWTKPKLTFKITCDYSYATGEEWYIACEEKTAEGLNLAFLTHYFGEDGDENGIISSDKEGVTFEYSHLETDVEGAIDDFYADYNIIKNIATSDFISKIEIIYTYSIPQGFLG